MKLTIPKLRARLLKLADKMAAIDQEAADLLLAIPDSPGRDRMLEHDIPRDVATAMDGELEILRCDHLQPAIELVRKTARLNKAALRRQWQEFRQEQEKLMRTLGPSLFLLDLGAKGETRLVFGAKGEPR